MKNESKVYGERVMEMDMDLSNFIYARLDGCFKKMISNNVLFLYSIH